MCLRLFAAICCIVLVGCSSSKPVKVALDDPRGPASVTFMTKQSNEDGKFVAGNPTLIEELTLDYERFSVTVPGDKIGVEDPNIAEPEGPVDYVKLFRKGDVVALRILGSDGGFSNVAILVFHLGKLLHHEAMALEDYRLFLRKGAEGSDLGQDEGAGITHWLTMFEQKN
jgi:hypothetical protein